MAKKTGPTNPNTKIIIQKLKKQTGKNTKIYRDIAKRLEKPKRIHPAINVSKLEKHLNKGDTAIIAGKVLGDGTITKPVTISAKQFSKTAKAKIEQAGGKCIPYEEMLKKNPTGSKIKIME